MVRVGSIASGHNSATMRVSSLLLLWSASIMAIGQTYTTVETYSGTGIAGLANGALLSAQYETPYSLCYDGATGTIYVADAYNHSIRKIVGGVVSTLAGNGTQGDVDGVGTAARFYVPTGIDYFDGHVYVSDNGNHKIKKIDALTGSTVTIAGTGSSGTTDGPALTAKFFNPTEVRVKSNGDVYVSDYGNHSIRKLTGGMVSTFAGLSGSLGDALGTGSAARFNKPTGIVFGTGGYLFVADQVNCKVKAIDGAGNVTLLAGSGATASVDGVGAAASFMRPTYIAWDPFGGLLVAEWMGNKIRRIESDGTVTTVAGTGSAGYLDGPALTAMFDSPYGVCVDNDGNVYIGDKENHVIRILNKLNETGIDVIATTDPALPLPALPTPTLGQVSIDVSSITAPLTGFSIHDERGSLVLRMEQQELSSLGKGSISIDATAWPSGVYAVLISTRERLYRSTIVR